MTRVNRPAKVLPGYYRLWNPMWMSSNTPLWLPAECTQVGADYEFLAFQYQQLNGTPTNNNANRSANLAAIKAGAAAAGHDVCCVNYLNGTYVPAASHPDGTHLPLSAYARAAGDTTQFLVDDGATYLLNISEYSTRHTAGGTYSDLGKADDALDRIGSGHWVLATASPDGLICDNLGWGIISPNYNSRTPDSGAPSTAGTSDVPINPRTGVGYTNREWLDFTVDHGAWLKGSVTYDPTTPYTWVVNGASGGVKWFDATAPTSLLMKCCEGLMLESWLRGAKDAATAFPDETTWKLDMNAVIDMQNHQKYALCCTKLWDTTHAHVHSGSGVQGDPYIQSADDDGDLAIVVQWHKFFLASFLMATDGRSFAHFRHDDGTAVAPAAQHERIQKDRWYNHANALGAPVESWNSAVGSTGLTGGITGAGAKRNASDGAPYSASTYYYRRLFQGGVVLVNPTGSAVVGAKVANLTPSGGYLTLDGTTLFADGSGVVTITLAANTGYVLKAL